MKRPNGRVKGLFLSLSVGLNDFQLKENAVEVERICPSVGLANGSSLRAKELSWYDAAFERASPDSLGP